MYAQHPEDWPDSLRLHCPQLSEVAGAQSELCATRYQNVHVALARARVHCKACVWPRSQRESWDGRGGAVLFAKTRFTRARPFSTIGLLLVSRKARGAGFESASSVPVWRRRQPPRILALELRRLR